MPPTVVDAWLYAAAIAHECQCLGESHSLNCGNPARASMACNIRALRSPAASLAIRASGDPAHPTLNRIEPTICVANLERSDRDRVRHSENVSKPSHLQQTYL